MDKYDLVEKYQAELMGYVNHLIEENPKKAHHVRNFIKIS